MTSQWLSFAGVRGGGARRGTETRDSRRCSGLCARDVGEGAEGWAGAQGDNLGGKGRARQAPEVAEGASLRVSGWSRRVLGRERWPAGAWATPGPAPPADITGRRRGRRPPSPVLLSPSLRSSRRGPHSRGAAPGHCHMPVSCPFQVRDDNKRQHPCLVEFSKLPEQERNYNLQMSLETLK